MSEQHLRTIREIAAQGKTVIVRADLNVPMDGANLLDGLRIERLKPTLEELIRCKAKIVIISHRGRPQGRCIPELSLAPIQKFVSQSLDGRPISFAKDCVGSPALQAIRSVRPGEIILLENLRFHSGEEQNEPSFAGQLAELGDIYVNDAFSCSHRSHASITGITNHLPSVAGFGLEKELGALSEVFEGQKRPVCAIVGGAKISSKLKVLSNLVDHADFIVIGGGMANTFLHVNGINVGKSLCENDSEKIVDELTSAARKKNVEIVLPVDAVVAKTPSASAITSTVPIAEIPNDQMILDIGPSSVRLIKSRLSLCKTLIWNGPLGVFEVEPFHLGTKAVAEAVVKLTTEGILRSVAGGGDTVAALTKVGANNKLSYISSAGGAFLEWLEGDVLPGIKPLLKTATKKI